MTDDTKDRYQQSGECNKAGYEQSPTPAGISPSGRGVGVLVRLQPDEIAALDAYCAKHAITRPEALRVGLGAITMMEGAGRG